MTSDSILGLDQVVLAVPALDAAIAAYEALFGAGCNGRGSAEGVAWGRFALDNTVLVLVAAQGEAGPLAHHLTGTAPGALAFAVAEPEAAARLVGRRGLPATGPVLDWLGRPALPLAPELARGLALLLTKPATARPGPVRLDHAVIRSGDPERTVALLAGRLGLELRLDRSNPAWGQRLLFFRCGDTVLEVSHALAEGLTAEPDRLWGLTWRVPDVGAWHARLEASGAPVSPLRTGRKPGTRIFTARDRALGLPTAVIGA